MFQPVFGVLVAEGENTVIMAKFKYGLFYDFHTPAAVSDVGTAFDADAFTDQVKACGVDFLTWHARCNQGFAYYNTNIGMRHPSLQYDMIREIGEACRRKGILFSVYFNGHLSEEELIEHPDWMDVNMDGQTLHTNNGKYGPFSRMVCYNSPFREHLREMVLELAVNYPVDGFFFDCLGPAPCVCKRCVGEMKERGIDWRDKDAVLEFSRFSVHRMCEMLNRAIREVKPNAFLFFNGRPFEEVIHMESHLECECLPTVGGYEDLPVYAHYMRTVAGPDKSILNMTGRFNCWGDFGGLRTAEGLEYDLFYGAANGMRPDIGGHFHPRGDMDQPVFDRIREVYGTLQQYDEWVLDAVNEPEIALVYPRRNMYRPNSDGVAAAVRMLTELKIQFDLVTDFVPWDKYRLLIFPDDVSFTDEYAKRVEAHLKRGGCVLATGRSGLDAEGRRFVIDSWPAVYAGPVPYDPLYFMPAGGLAEKLPRMPLSVYASGIQAGTAEGAKTEMFLVKPCLNHGWDGLHSNYYNAPQEITGDPFLVRKGNIICCTAEIFGGYCTRAPDHLRKLLGNMIRALIPDLKLRSATLPSFSRAFVQRKGNAEMVHILSYCPEKRCNAVALEDRISLVDTEISLRTDGRKIRKVYLAPERKELPFAIRDGYCTVRIPLITGYALVVFEQDREDSLPLS